jgi:transposase-like protein
VAWHGVVILRSFGARFLDLVEAGRPVADVAKALGTSGQSVCTWRRQDGIDQGLAPGLTSTEKAELVAARHRIAPLETELRATRRALELVRDSAPPPTGGTRSSA